jgi:hypothetical protein
LRKQPGTKSSFNIGTSKYRHLSKCRLASELIAEALAPYAADIVAATQGVIPGLKQPQFARFCS